MTLVRRAVALLAPLTLLSGLLLAAPAQATLEPAHARGQAGVRADAGVIPDPQAG